jgi:DNA-binding NarL/FixJ family response regulator
MRRHTSAKIAKGLRPPTRAQAPEDPQPLEALVRQLLERAQRSAGVAAKSAEPKSERSAEVLFDCEVDGVRCVLARVGPDKLVAVSLSPRESEIARMIAKGYPNKMIASVLDISVWTVSTHLRRIFAKLGVTSRAAMVTTMFENHKL